MGTKTCKGCQQTLPYTLEFFGKDSRALSGMRGQCRKCETARSLRSQRKYSRQTRQRQATWVQRNRERVRKTKAEWVRSNPEVCSANWHRRKARKLGAEGFHTVEDIKALYESQKGLCAYCSEPVGEEYHVDHVIPLSRGGGNGPDNLAIACPTCNRSKGAKLLSEWTNRPEPVAISLPQ